MPLILRPPGTRPLPERLSDLGRARRVAAVTAALTRLLAGLGLAVVVAGAVDVAVHLPPLPRAGLLVGLLAAGGVGWLRLVRPAAREPVHPLAVALRLEDAYPRLNDALASSVAFLTGSDRLTRFQRVAEIRAENLAERVDLWRAVPGRRAWGGVWALVAVGLLAAALAAVHPTRAAAVLLRLADPFGGHRLPTRTVVTLIDPPTLLALGDPYPLRFRVTGRVPEQATVSLRPAGQPAADEPVPVPEGGEVSRPLDPGRVARDFEVRVTAGDGDTGWTRVAVAPPPKLVPVGDRPSPLVSLTYPAYTGQPPADLPDGTGVVEAVAGTRVRFRAAADRDVVSAVFRPQFDLAAFHAAAAVAPLAADNPLSAILAGELAPAFAADLPVRCSGPELAADFVPPLPGLYALRFTDGRGLTGTRLFDFRLFPDPQPVATLLRPAAITDSLDLLPTARLTLLAAAEDVPFAVRWLAVEYRVGGPDAPFRRLPLADADGAGDLVAAAGGGPAGLIPLRPQRVDALRELPVVAFVKPDGTPPGDGDVVTLRAAAADWDDRTALKEPGRSKEVDLRIASRASLEAKLQKELADLRPDLLRRKEELRSAREAIDDAARTPAPAEASSRLATADAAVRGAKAKVDDPAAGLAAQTDRLRRTQQQNALPRSPTTDKVQDAAAAAKRAAGKLDEAEAKTAAARQATDKPAADRAKAAAEAAAAVAAAEDEVAKLLERLEQWGGAGEVRGEARAIKDQVTRAGDQADAAATPGDRDRAADKLEQAGDQAAGLLGKAGRLAVEKDAQAAAARAAAEAAAQQADALGAEAGKQPAGSDKAAELANAAAAARRQAEAQKGQADQAAAEADALRKAVREAGGQAVPDDLRRAADELRKNRPGESADARQSAVERLAKLADPLAERPTESADQLKKKRQQSADAADKLAAAQDELRKKTKEAEGTADPMQRAEQLQKLAREQQRLKEQADLLAERLTRERNEPAAKAAQDAAAEMAAAADRLERGQSPQEQQAEAGEKLEQAKRQLDQEKKESAEQLSREQREQLAEKLKAVRDRQQAAVDEAVRVQAAAAEAKRWDRPLLASLGDLEDREAGLAAEVAAAAGKDLADLPVFAKLAAQAGEAMTRAAKRAAERRDDAALADTFDPPVEAAAGDRLLKPMRTALAKLDQILSAVTPDPKDKKPAGDAAAGGGGAGGGGGEDGKPPPAGGGGIPPLAQLKALRAMQAEVAERTAEFARSHRDPDKLTDDDRAELADLEQAQRDVAELFAKLAEVFRQPPELP